MRKNILFELNEVPFSVIDYFCQKFPQSHMARIVPLCVQYTTYTDDEGELHPWATWPTVHRGVTNHDHKLKDFGESLEAVDMQYPPIWKIMQSHNISTGVFASLHSYPMPSNVEQYAFYIPDLFAADSQVHPSKIRPFQEFNLKMSRRSGRNVDSGVDLPVASRMLLNTPSLGVTMKTCVSLAGQLLNERRIPRMKTRRRTFQSVLAFDIYMKLLRSHQPQFSTFFSNHVASAMHRYWAATFPGDYAVNHLPPQWIHDYREEIDFAMERVDEFLKQLTQFADVNPEYTVIVASSMGQKATIAELVKTRSSVKDMPKFLTRLGLNQNEWEPRPAMHPQYNLVVQEDKVAALSNILDKLEVGGSVLTYRTKRNGFFSIDFGHVNLEIDYALLNGEKISFDELGICNETVDDESAGTAYHDPEGSLLIYDPQHITTVRCRKAFINTVAIAPSLLENFGLPVPTYMSNARIPELVE